MCNGRPERTLLGACHIDMDPLVITGGLGKEVDLFLGDPVPRTVTKVSAYGTLELLDSGVHLHSYRPSSARFDGGLAYDEILS